MHDIPFVKLFETVKTYYVFDVNTTSIIRIDENLYKSLCDYIAGKIVFSQIDDDSVKKLKS